MGPIPAKVQKGKPKEKEDQNRKEGEEPSAARATTSQGRQTNRKWRVFSQTFRKTKQEGEHLVTQQKKNLLCLERFFSPYFLSFFPFTSCLLSTTCA
eukprot:m.21256 g.21256  ORF g.21256 m.21256 type:complete len:97 (+) comp9065_c0_seq1:853-1143(+)